MLVSRINGAACYHDVHNDISAMRNASDLLAWDFVGAELCPEGITGLSLGF
jgi:hypothetical protein